MSVAELTEVTICVTQEDIDAGHQGDCGKCPIALAFRRVVPGATNIDVGRIELEFDHPSDWSGDGFSLTLPNAATDFVDDFDAHGAAAVWSFDFTLAIPAQLRTAWLAEIAARLEPTDAGDETGTEAEKAAWAGMSL